MLWLILMSIRPNLSWADQWTDEQLMERYRDGNVSAFRVLMNRHERRVFNFLLRMLGDRDRANELLQETFLRVVKQRARYSPTAKFTTWIFRIARNLGIDELRKRKNRNHRRLDHSANPSDGRPLVDTIPGDSADGFRRAEGNQITRRITEALSHLSEEQREVFVLRQIQQLSFREIADVVQISENTVKSRMRYALEQLRMHLADYGAEVFGGRDGSQRSEA